MLPELKTIADKLQSERAKLLTVLAAASEAQRQTLVYAEGWNLYDLVSHLAAAEQENMRFVREMLQHDGARHQPVGSQAQSLDAWNTEAVGQRKGQAWEERMSELDAVRRSTMDTIATITAEQFAHKGIHLIWGEKTVEGLLKILYLHDIMHRNDVARRLREV
jgi:uncharacterized damage-inducible protein DinB